MRSSTDWLDEGVRPHARLSLRTRCELAAVHQKDSPLLGMLLEIEAEGEPLVRPRAGPVAHIVLVLDLSASMNRDDKFPVLRAALKVLLEELSDRSAVDVLVSVVVFSKGAEVLVEAVPARELPRHDLFYALLHNTRTFGPYTDIGGALKHAGVIATRHVERHPLVPVRVYLLTDGLPQDEVRARAVLDRVATIPADLHALAFGADANVGVLQGLFGGCRGGTVKAVDRYNLATAFGNIAASAQRVVATRSKLAIRLAEGVVGGDVYRYRPARVRFPSPGFVEGKRFFADLGTIETGRTYSILFEIRPPQTVDESTPIGVAEVRIPSFGGPVVSRVQMTLPRVGGDVESGPVDNRVRTARDILDAVDAADPAVALRALELRRRLYEAERRDRGLLDLLDRAIAILRQTGSLESLSAGEHATLFAHTCTNADEDWEALLSHSISS